MNAPGESRVTTTTQAMLDEAMRLRSLQDYLPNASVPQLLDIAAYAIAALGAVLGEDVLMDNLVSELRSRATRLSSGGTS